MGKPALDVLLASFFDFCIADLKRNPWLLTDIYGALATDPLSRVEYGETLVTNPCDWFKNNKIETVMYLRRDHGKFPCISIAMSTSTEDIPHTSLGDEGLIEDIDPSYANVQIDKIYKDFTPTAYDPASGQITMPDSINTCQLAPGLHMIVENKTGRAFVVQTIVDDQNFTIVAGSQLDLKDIYVMPVTAAWKVHRRRTRMHETFEIGAHASSLPEECIWLSQLIEYCLLKYKDKFLDGRNIQLSTWSASNVSKNDNYLADNVYSRFFTLSFQTEFDWIESIAPPIAKVTGKIYIDDGTLTPEDLWPTLKNQGWVMAADKGRK